MNLTPTFSAGIGWPEKQSHCATATSANQQVICRVLHILMYLFSMHNSWNKGTFCVIEQCMLKKYVAIMARPFFTKQTFKKKKWRYTLGCTATYSTAHKLILSAKYYWNPCLQLLMWSLVNLTPTLESKVSPPKTTGILSFHLCNAQISRRYPF